MREFTQKVRNGNDLNYEEMTEAALFMFDERTPEEEVGDFLAALADKGETAYEVAALAEVTRGMAIAPDVPAAPYTDNCGTGGDGSDSFNISTTSAFVLAAAGVPVAKHGNRKISSRSGSSDVLEALGIGLEQDMKEAARQLREEGIAFLFAPRLHPKMKRIGRVRSRLGRRTIFNLTGPLTNPVPLESQFTGISRKDFTMGYASVLRMQGRKRAIVVCGAGGMDEASLAGQNDFVLLDHGDLIPFTLEAEDVGLQSAPLSALRGGDGRENAEILRSVLGGARGPKFDAVAFNAGLGLFAAGRAETAREGVELAQDIILSGKATEKLESVIRFHQQAEEAVTP
ncbi:anthranilate phosphoribosyltransferase [Bhargavaea ginsengi]|uniref:Anthranilate phosphoribosyltransferase n=1 Tax=Bhargavaea ginsengi TaxID=426757 RepID=A0A1H6ZXA3_9BACL|nr:anthranilate phosphoribosyltransferase [Bhargavaea ginsengi]MCM3087633.1 anthranilate phosphoribosyltransferase [Bhargavaea ginsengi]SEJ54362.1 anthranilate phosphoribosyltransferase [Bhargavaea ginsengi]